MKTHNSRDRELIFVSGPSGCGKSTFINLFISGNLPQEIKILLPTAIPDPQIIELNNVMKGDLDKETLMKILDPQKNVILHYDIVLPRKNGIDDYNNDPGLNFLQNEATVYVVNIKPDAERLKLQFKTRARKHAHSKSMISRLWKNYFHTPMRKLKSLNSNKALKTADLYEIPNWIDQCYDNWEEYISERLTNNPSSTIINIKPVSNDNFTGNNVSQQKEMSFTKRHSMEFIVLPK